MTERKTEQSQFGCVTLLAIAFIVVFGAVGFVWYGLDSGRLASTAALPQNKIPQNQLAEIGRIVGLQPSENVLYFYSATMTVSGDGNLFTNERIISYTDYSGTSQVTDATYDEVEDITITPSTSWLEDSTITITLKDGTTFDLWVSTESGRDIIFYDRLIEEWKQHRDDVRDEELR